MERELRAEVPRDLCNLILNTGEEEIDFWNRDRGTSSFKSIERLLLDFKEDRGGRACTGRKGAALDVRLAGLVALLSLKGGYKKLYVLLKPDGRYLLTRKERALE